MKNAIGFLMLLLLAGIVPAAEIEIREWDVPWPDTRPRDPAVAADGTVWFVGQRGDYLGRLDPRSGEFRRFELEEGSGPHNLVLDSAGQVWFAGNRKAYLGELDPKSGRIRKIATPEGAKDPHTLVFDPAGNLWFTSQISNSVGRLRTDDGKIDLVKLPKAGSRPYGIVIDRAGRPWFNEFGANRIGTIDPKSLELREYELPEGTRDRRIALDSEGGVWYVDYARGRIARLDPKGGAVEEWSAPGGSGSLPYAMAADDRGRFWFVETGPQPNRLVGFDPETETFFSVTEIPSGGSAVRHMVFDAKSRSLWFGTDKNTIGRALVPR